MLYTVTLTFRKKYSDLEYKERLASSSFIKCKINRNGLSFKMPFILDRMRRIIIIMHSQLYSLLM